jgi:MFS family permease
MGEGPYGSATNKLISNWFPRRQQASAVGWANAGTPLRGAIAGPIVGFIALAYGWRVSFVVIAFIGLCWAIAWMLLVTDRPEQNLRVSAAERTEIAADPEVPTAGPRVNLGRLLIRPGESALSWDRQKPRTLIRTFPKAAFRSSSVLHSSQSLRRPGVTPRRSVFHIRSAASCAAEIARTSLAAQRVVSP